jgi:hypothetical protein
MQPEPVPPTVLRSRAQPPAKAPAWAERLVRLMDDGLRIPGTEIRLGLDAILGFLLPGVGDALGAVSALSLFGLAVRRGVPYVVLLRMALNVAIDALVGAIPLLGDVFDVGFKANRRNLQLIERSAAAPGKPHESGLSHWLFVGAILLVVASALCLPLLLFGMLLRALWPS